MFVKFRQKLMLPLIFVESGQKTFEKRHKFFFCLTIHIFEFLNQFGFQGFHFLSDNSLQILSLRFLFYYFFFGFVFFFY